MEEHHPAADKPAHLRQERGILALDTHADFLVQGVSHYRGAGYILGAIRGTTHPDSPPKTEPCFGKSPPQGVTIPNAKQIYSLFDTHKWFMYIFL